MDSLLSYESKEHPAETPLQVKRRWAPWLWAVDVEYGPENSHQTYNGIYIKGCYQELDQRAIPNHI
jgi:hypothetical protein